jgi:hypothetical protein
MATTGPQWARHEGDILVDVRARDLKFGYRVDLPASGIIDPSRKEAHRAEYGEVFHMVLQAEDRSLIGFCNKRDVMVHPDQIVKVNPEDNDVENLEWGGVDVLEDATHIRAISVCDNIVAICTKDGSESRYDTKGRTYLERVSGPEPGLTTTAVMMLIGAQYQ